MAAEGQQQKIKVRCSCGRLVDGVSSYFGIPLHVIGKSYRVCQKWSGT